MTTKIFKLVFIIVISVNSYSQTIQERELDLRTFSGPNIYNKKDKALELLSIDSFNLVAIDYIIQIYDKLDQTDSISAFYNDLIQSNPNSTEPYIVRNKLSHYESLSREQRIRYLKDAYKIDTSDYEVNYYLAQLNHELFTVGYKEEQSEQQLKFYAKESIKYMTNICEIDEKYIESMKFPLIQLSNYLGNLQHKIEEYSKYNNKISFFPIDAFMDLQDNWKTDYSIEFFNLFEMIFFRLNWYSNHLYALNEPELSDSVNKTVYRFTYLRTFHNPIAVRLEKDNDTIILYWKVCDGAGGYAPGNLTINEKKSITNEEWIQFEEAIENINYWNLNTNSCSLGFDGSRWIIEGLKNGEYHVVDRWCGGELDEVGRLMLKLTSLKIPKGKIY